MPQKPTPPTESRTLKEEPDSGKPFTVSVPLNPEPRLTIRDSFAIAAMQGWLASTPAGISHPAFNGEALKLAAASYVIADAMLNERSAETPTPLS